MEQPRRVVSLVPSLSELVWALGAGEALAGRTRFCTEPAEMAMAVPEFGGTKNPDVAAISALRPDLVIANKEENRKEDIDALRERGVRVVVTDPNSVREAMDMVLQLGVLLGCQDAARRIHTETIEAIGAGPATMTRVFVPIWYRPLMALGRATYGNDLVREAGGENVFGQLARYPEVSLEDVAAARPELILLPDEPYRFTEEHVAFFRDIAPARVVDGQLLWWYGPRMGASIRALREIITDGAG